ncbi:hypothetical protein [uncultured Methanobrevibacter sp.]|uniref:hypothetical protein n=1 Tax=uncultured Methanobrevibacter sp. TaxID=253161 RepID=UPI0025D2D50C|nr:hypothetical protein [uncultured Methanobrevibacter sp.]
MDDEKYEAIIAKQLERENNIKELKKDYIDDIENPKKQITVKIFPNTHKKLKVIAASKDTSLEKIATAIVENKVEELDIVDYVKRAFENAEEFEEGFDWLKKEDADNSTYDLNDKILKKGRPRKRINVKVTSETHIKLRVLSAIQDRSLDKIVGSIIEYEIGEENKINTSKLMDELLLVLMLN